MPSENTGRKRLRVNVISIRRQIFKPIHQDPAAHPIEIASVIDTVETTPAFIVTVRRMCWLHDSVAAGKCMLYYFHFNWCNNILLVQHLKNICTYFGLYLRYLRFCFFYRMCYYCFIDRRAVYISIVWHSVYMSLDN